MKKLEAQDIFNSFALMNFQWISVYCWIIFILTGKSESASPPAEAIYSVATGSFGTMWISVGIFNEHLTRSEAANRCVEYGFDTLEDGERRYIRYIAIKQKLQQLQSTAFPYQVIELWVDFFRLDDEAQIWYQTTQCWPATDKIDFDGNQPTNGRNCVAMQFSDGFNYHRHLAIGCEKSISFLCVKTNITLPPFKIYSDASLQYLPEGCSSFSRLNVDSYENCENICRSRFECIAVTYISHSRNCTLFDIGPNEAWVTYALVYSSGSVHGAKDGTDVTFYSSATTSVTSSVSSPLPSCGEFEHGPTYSFSPSPSVSVTQNSPKTTSAISTTTEINLLTITAYIGYTEAPLLEVYEEEVTWFDALYGCNENSMRLDSKTVVGLYLKTRLIQILKDHNYTGGLKFWHGYFKSSQTSDDWYRTNYSIFECLKNEDPLFPATDSSNSGQCSLLVLTGLGPDDTGSITVDNCSKTYPYFCKKMQDEPQSLVETNGWHYVNLPSSANEEIYNDIYTADACKEIFLDKWSRVAWSYFHNLYVCYIVTAAEGYGHVAYEIGPSDDAVTHGYKGYYQLTFHPKAANGFTREYPQEFPTCSLSSSTTTVPVTSLDTSASKTTTTPSTNLETSTSTTITAPSTSLDTSTSKATTTPSKNLETSTSTTITAPTTSLDTSTSTMTTLKTPTSSHAASTSSYTQLTSLYTTPSSGTCKRSCPCRHTATYNSTEIVEVVEEIIRNLTINRAQTSKARRELTSAEDPRTSAQVVGGLGIAILSSVFAAVVIFDLPRLLSVFHK